MELDVELSPAVKKTAGGVLSFLSGFDARTDIAPHHEGDFALVIRTDHEQKRTWLDVVELDSTDSSKQLAADQTATLGRVMLEGRTAHLFTAEQWERWRAEQA